MIFYAFDYVYFSQIFHVKSHFAYNPRDDPLLPCQEAGLAFARNDVLHVFDKTDAMWWQVSCLKEILTSCILLHAHIFFSLQHMLR